MEEELVVTAGKATLILAVQVNQIKNIAMCSNGIRKMVRFVRAPILFSSIRNRKINLNFKDTLSALSSLFIISLLISDSADLVFYFTDHYSFLTLIGVSGDKMISSLFDDIGNYLWVLGAVAQIISILAKAYIMKLEGQSLDLKKSRNPYLLIGDLLAACI